jgi:hypothetical protein
MFTAYWRQRLAVPERPLLEDKPTDWVDADVRDVREPPLLGKQRDQLRAYVTAFEQAAAAYRRIKQRVVDASQDTERAVERATTLRTLIVLENRTFTTETGAPTASLQEVALQDLAMELDARINDSKQVRLLLFDRLMQLELEALREQQRLRRLAWQLNELVAAFLRDVPLLLAQEWRRRQLDALGMTLGKPKTLRDNYTARFRRLEQDTEPLVGDDKKALLTAWPYDELAEPGKVAGSDADAARRFLVQLERSLRPFWGSGTPAYRWLLALLTEQLKTL